jgi:hypothetical protein
MRWLERLRSLEEKSELLEDGTAKTAKSPFYSFCSASPQECEILRTSFRQANGGDFDPSTPVPKCQKSQKASFDNFGILARGKTENDNPDPLLVEWGSNLWPTGPGPAGAFAYETAKMAFLGTILHGKRRFQRSPLPSGEEWRQLVKFTNWTGRSLFYKAFLGPWSGG